MWLLTNYMVMPVLEDNLIKEVQLKSELSAKSIDSFVAREKYHLEAVVDHIATADNFDENFLYHTLVTFTKKYHGNSYYMSLDDGFFVDSTGWKPGKDYVPTERDWYVGASNFTDVYVSLPYIDAETGDVVITFSKSFTTSSGRVGVVATDIFLSRISELLNITDVSNKTFQDKDSYIFIVTKDRSILYHPHKEFNPTNKKFIQLADILGGKLNDILSSNDLTLEDRIFKDYDGNNRLVFFNELEETSWYVGTVSPTTILDIKGKLGFYLTLIAISIVSLCIVVSCIGVNKLTVPILQTIDMAEHIKNLDVSKDIVVAENLHTFKEIHQLQEALSNIIMSFRLFATSLQDAIKDNNMISSDISKKVDYLLGKAEEISATSEELSSVMEESSLVVSSLASSADEIDKCISDFALKVEEGATTSSQISQRAIMLHDKFKTSIDTTVNIYKTTQEEIKNSIDAAKEIEKVKFLSETILDMADKTNLLYYIFIIYAKYVHYSIHIS